MKTPAPTLAPVTSVWSFPLTPKKQVLLAFFSHLGAPLADNPQTEIGNPRGVFYLFKCVSPVPQACQLCPKSPDVSTRHECAHFCRLGCWCRGGETGGVGEDTRVVQILTMSSRGGRSFVSGEGGLAFMVPIYISGTSRTFTSS